MDSRERYLFEAERTETLLSTTSQIREMERKSVRMASQTYRSIIEDMIMRNRPKGPCSDSDLLGLCGSEFVYLARGPPNGALTDFNDVTSASSFIHATIDMKQAEALTRDAVGDVALVHNHTIGRAYGTEEEAETLRRLEYASGRCVCGVVLGHTGMFYTAAMSLAVIGLSRSLSLQEKQQRGDRVVEVLYRQAGTKARSWVATSLEGRLDFEQAFGEVVPTVAKIYAESGDLSVAFCPSREWANQLEKMEFELEGE